MSMFTPFVKEAFEKTVLVAKFFCGLHVTKTYLCTIAYLYGPSMFPTLRDGDVVLSERISARLGKIGPGDLVHVRNPDCPTKVSTKRVKAIEGEVVSYSLGSDEVKTVIVPKGHVWVEGDNPGNSNDSRNYGAVPCGLLYARIFLRVWPPKDFSLLGHKLP